MQQFLGVSIVGEKAIFGIEEEVFVTEPERSSVQSLYYLAKLLRKDPKFYYTHTASNFSRGRDIWQGLMSGVEISTSMQADANSLVEELASRRRDLMDVCTGLIIPLGHLINYNAPTNTCALQIHIGGGDKERIYKNLIRFLPLLTLLTVNSPGADGKYFGKSFRISESFAIGPLKTDWTYRFQDIILAKRLGTIEVRIFDPIWDLGRIKILMRAIEAIANLKKSYDSDINCYNRLRPKIALRGYTEELDETYDELRTLCEIPKDLLMETPSDQVWRYYEENGLLKTYSALDSAYRTGIFNHRQIPQTEVSMIKILAGLSGYYIPKLPYMLWKFWRES